MVRSKGKEDESSVPPAFQPGDLVTLKDHTAKAFEPKYKGKYRVIKFFRKDTSIVTKFKRRRNETPCNILKKTNTVQEIVNKIPDFKKFGRAAKFGLNPDNVPNLKWNTRQGR